MLQQIGTEIWSAEGRQTAQNLGFHFPLSMAVVRLECGDLWVWSPIPLSDELRQDIDELGHVRHLISPNAFHHLSMSQWQTAYPKAQLCAAPGLSKRRPDLLIDATLGVDATSWDTEIATIMFQGNLLFEEAVFFHHTSGTLIFTDILQNIPADLNTGWRGGIAKLDKMTGPEPQVPRKFRLTFRDKPALKRAVARVLDLPVKRVIIAHGAPVTSSPQAFLKRAFSWL